MTRGWKALQLLGSMVDNLKHMARVRLLVRAPSAILYRKRSCAEPFIHRLVTVTPYLFKRLE